MHELGELGPLLDRELHISAGHVSYDGAPHIDDDHEQHHGGGDHCHPQGATAPSQGDHGLVPRVFNAPLFPLPARPPEGKPATICG